MIPKDKKHLRLIDLAPRREYLKAPADVKDLRLGSIALHSVSDAGAISEESVAEATMLKINAIQMNQEERALLAGNSADDGKAIFFGRQHRMYAISAFLVDSNAAPGQGVVTGTWAAVLSRSSEMAKKYGGHLLSAWKEMYNNQFRLSACLRDRNIVKLAWRTSEFFGYLAGNLCSLDSGSPGLVTISLTFISVLEEDLVELPTFDAETKKSLQEEVIPTIAISREGAEDAGLPLIRFEQMVEKWAAFIQERDRSKVGQAMEGRKIVPPEPSPGR